MENKRDEDDKVSRRVYKVIEAKSEKVGIAETKRRRKKRSKKKKKKPKVKRTMKIKKVVEEWKIWDEEVEMAKLEEETKRLVPERFHK